MGTIADETTARSARQLVQPDERVLYVDDEREAREAFASAAHHLGFRVDTASGGGEALTMVSQQRYAIIAVDLRMPTLNGLSLIQLLRPKWPDASYLLVTGAHHLDLPEQANGEPLVDGVVSKPWTLDKLSPILTRSIDRHRERRRDGAAVGSPDLPVLFAHDRGENADSFRRMLRDESPAIELVQARSANEAMDLVLSRSFRAAVVDFEVGGLEAVKGLRRRDPHLAIIVLGLRDDDSACMALGKAGAQDYLVKSKLSGYVLRQSIRYAIERKLTEERVHFLLHHDPVTGLANRNLLRERLTHAIAEARRGESHLAVLLLDIDRFKAVNDSLGHDMGDRLLKVVAQRLRENVGERQTVARLGGDEFAVLLEGIDGAAEAVLLAQRILEALVPPARLSDYEIAATGSIGVAVYPEHGETAAELLQRADKAMYRAKQKGRDAFELYSNQDEESRSGVLQRLRFESGIRHALERDEYVVFYQPQVDVRRERVLALEALIRWRHPRVGLVPPNDFMPFLESSGLIKGVGEWVLQTACRDLKEWLDHGFREIRMSVNLSARQFEDSDLVATVERILEETEVPSGHLELEITESLLMQDIERTRAILESLKALGVRIAIDDFGTGYSSLNYLAKFPLDCLKIDRSFVRDIGTDADHRAICEAIIGLGHSLRLDVVAEGIETEEQLALLREIDGFQGFLVGRPEPAGATFEVLQRFDAGAS